MLKMMVFSISAGEQAYDKQKYFELGMIELDNFLNFLIEKSGWDKDTFNPITEKLKNVLSQYEPQFREKDWCEQFKAWLSSLEIGDNLCMYDGWITKWEDMEIVKKRYIERFIELKNE